MYKIIDTINHEVLLGTGLAVFNYAKYRFAEKDQEWKDDHHWDLKKIGISDEIRTFEGAVKFLNLIYVELVEMGDVVFELENNKYVLVSKEE